MRNGQNNKRMRGRNNNNNNNNNRRGQNPLTRVFESNGPDIKIRGTASHIAEKYVQLARDARSSGDPVGAENYYQHAEHYFRLIAAAQEQFRQNQPQPQLRNDSDFAPESDEDNETDGFSAFGAEPGFAPQPQPQFQPREQREFREQRPHYQQPQPQPQPQYQPQPSIPAAPVGDVDRLPSFITGAPAQPTAGAAPEGNGHANGGAERFPQRRRRRPGPRPPAQGAQPAAAAEDVGGGE